MPGKMIVQKDGAIFILLGVGVAGILAASWQFVRTGEEEVQRPLVTLTGEIASSAPPKAASSRRLAPLAGVALVETALPEENDPGSATLQYRDGRIRRFAVRDWIASDIQLIGVSDASALFQAQGEQMTLPLSEARLPDAEDKAASGLPGIDIDARPGTANPAIAR